MIRGQVVVIGLLAATLVTGCNDNTTLEVRKDGTGSGKVTSRLITMPGPVGKGELDCGEKCTLDTYFKNTYLLTATPAPGSRFVRWDYSECPPELVRESLDCEVYTGVPGPTVVTATFNENRVTVTKAGAGSGRVVSAPAAIDCGATCSATFDTDTSVTLTASVEAGSTFTGWSGACSGTSTTCTVVANDAKNVTATFVKAPGTLNVTKAGSGSGSVISTPSGIDCGATCSAMYETGTVVSLTPMPGSGSAFAGWSGACSGMGACTVTVQEVVNVTATFTTVSLPLSVRFSGVGSGRVTSSPAGVDCTGDCMSTFSTGTLVTLTAVAGTGSVFSGWGGACMGTGTCTVTLSAATEVVATFSPAPISLTVVRAGSGSGTVTSMPAGIDCGTTCTASFTAATTVTLTATPDATSIFTGWSGACSGMTTCTVPLMVASTVTATFQLKQVAVSVMLSGTGTGVVTSTPAGLDCGVTCSANFVAGTMVTLTATPTVGSTFTGWTGACTGTAACVVTATMATAVGATFTRDVFPLTVSKAGTGGGTVSSNPAGISCGTSCTSSWDSATVVTLVAMPDSSSSFAGWSGACSGTGSCVVTMSAARSVTATFNRLQFALSVMRTGAGTGTVTSSPAGIACGATCSASYDAGTMVTLTATAATGSTFSGWSGGGCTGTAPCTVTVSAATSVAANFDRAQYAFSVIRSGTGGGTVTSVPAGISCGATCSTQLFHGDRITLSAAADQSSTFAGWSGGCTGTGACVVDVTTATTVTATFTRSTALLTVAKAGTGSGTVTSAPAGLSCGATCVGAFDVGSSVTLTASPAADSTFTGWSGAGISCPGTGTCTVNLAAASSVTATFTLNRYTVSVAKAGAGSGTVVSSPAGISCGATCAADFDHGSAVVLTAVAGPGSTFTGWSGAGFSCPGTGTCTVTPTSALSAIATFARTQRTLTIVRSGAGSGTVTSVPAGITCGTTCAAPFDDGSVVALTAVGAPGSTFTGWSGGGCSGTGTCAVSMTAATTVTATFEPTQYTLSVARTGTGVGTVTSSPGGISCGATCSASFLEGTSVTLTASANVSSTFAGWSGGGCTGTGTCTVSLTAATTVTANFTLNEYTLFVSRVGTGGGTVTSAPAGITCGATCGAPFAHGTLVTLAAVADGTSTFTGWGGACTGTGTCTVNMTSARSVTANFTYNQYQLQVLKVGTGGGTVNSSPPGISCGATCSVLYDANTPVSLFAVQDGTSTFTGWSGAGCSGTGTCSVTMSAARTVTATFTRVQYQLQVLKAGTGGGLVTSSPGGITCGATCNAPYDANTPVVLTAAQDSLSTFAGWSGGGCSGTGTCTVTMSAARTVTATFNRLQYQLQVTKAGTGSGTVTSSPGGISCGASCSALFDANSVVTLTAVQDSTSTFVGWSAPGCSGTGTCTVTMSSARSVIALFDDIGLPLTVSKSGSGTGTVVSVPPAFINCGATCSATVAPGTSISFTATADPGSSFAGWTGACSGTGPCSVVVNASTTVGAIFVLPNYVFATSIGVNAAMGGLSGADSICAQRALAGGLRGTFKAWLSTSTTNALSRLGTSSGWIRPDGLPFANSQADLVAGRILYPLRLDEFGTDVFTMKAFTSTLGEGTLNTGVSTCSDWTSNVGQTPAGAGLTSLSTTGWTAGASAPCGSQQRLYCFGVDAPASVKVTAPAQFRRAFVTDSVWLPGGGIASADVLCNAEASSAGLPGTYLALLTPLGVSAASRFNTMGPPWVRVDNVSLSPTANSFFTDPFWTATLNVTPLRSYGTATTWSGSTNLLFQGAPSNTCQGWTSGSVNDSARAGVMNDSEVAHAFGGAGTVTCSNALPLVCLQQ